MEATVAIRCRELMIGDWFLTSDGVPCRVDQNFGNHIWGYGQDLSISTDEPYAIPITKEILEKNGWYSFVPTAYTCCQNYLSIKSEGDIHIVLDEETLSVWMDYSEDEEGTNPDLKASVRCVHELQDALRLVRLKEFADSFKL